MSPYSRQPTTLPSQRRQAKRRPRRGQAQRQLSQKLLPPPNSGAPSFATGAPCMMTPLCLKVGPESLSKGNRAARLGSMMCI